VVAHLFATGRLLGLLLWQLLLLICERHRHAPLLWHNHHRLLLPLLLCNAGQ
jgi:hypothetical protein